MSDENKAESELSPEELGDVSGGVRADIGVEVKRHVNPDPFGTGNVPAPTPGGGGGGTVDKTGNPLRSL